MLKQLIGNRKEQLALLCQKHRVSTMFVFGSFAKGSETINSDIDLLVDIAENDPIKKGELLMSLWDSLESFFSRKVDLLTPNSLQNPYLIKDIEQTKLLVFDGKEKEIFI